MDRYLILTCDTEALPSTARAEHVDRLIWGRVENSAQPAGIDLMMDLADEAGVKVSFFLDVIERHLYGAQIDEAGQRILERKHDLQLHSHATLLPESFWNERGFAKPTWDSNLFDEQASRVSLGHAVDLFKAIAGHPPLAYRAGAYRYNANELAALPALGVRLSFNYNPTTSLRKAYPFGYAAGALPVFRWSNGLVEVPVGALPEEAAGQFSTFEFHQFAAVEALLRFVERFWRNNPEGGALVMVLHSWAFLERETPGSYVFQPRIDQRRVDLFRDFLRLLPCDTQIVTAAEFGALIEEGRIAPRMERPLSAIPRTEQPLISLKPPKGGATNLSVAPPSGGLLAACDPFRADCCNICGAPRADFIDCGGARNRCGKCMSFERTRIFKWAYDLFLKREFPLEGKEILACCPGDAEIKYLLKDAKRLLTFDARPVSWFDMQMDISDMKPIADESFDCVVALGVLPHVRRDREAIDEVWRVLRKGGRFLAQASNYGTWGLSGKPTEPFANPTEHYGAENLEKYDVGTFRYYGDLDLIELLSRRFLVKTFYGLDPVTGCWDFIACGIKREG